VSRPESKVTSQGQISVPAEVRRKLGVGPGSVLEWQERKDGFLVRRTGRRSSTEIHAALFDGATPKRTGSAADGIRRYIRKRHAR
jgi:AbrB family looped-hinge helix DNA binding protein